MQEQFVKYEQAVALKELGYNKYSWFGMVCSLYEAESKHTFYANGIGDETYISAPLKSQVFDWFRKQGYDTKVQKESEGLYFGFYWTGAAWVIVGNGSYEEAESACIDKLIDIIKNK
jgi:hypothetical protein